MTYGRYAITHCNILTQSLLNSTPTLFNLMSLHSSAFVVISQCQSPSLSPFPIDSMFLTHSLFFLSLQARFHPDATNFSKTKKITWIAAIVSISSFSFDSSFTSTP